jgi:hypothetical protein
MTVLDNENNKNDMGFRGMYGEDDGNCVPL